VGRSWATVGLGGPGWVADLADLDGSEVQVELVLAAAVVLC
jgi:hypothetical protein